MDEQYHTDLNEWRHQADENLRAEKSWLALTGLYWLEQGENVFGSHPENAVPFPGGAGEENVGVFRLMDGTVSVEVNEDMQVKVNGESVRAMEIKPDVSGEPDDIDCGRIAMRVVKRGDRFGIRMWDQENPKRLEFTGRRWFKARDEYLIEAKFHDYDPPREMPIANILGDTEDAQMAGYVEFEIGGQKARLEAMGTEPGNLFIIFKDATNGVQTYPAGRYMYSDPPKEGKVILDFNRAYNPPCVFTDYATCPLPPPENHLPFAVTAGEILPE